MNAFVGDIERAEVDAKRAAAGGSRGKLGGENGGGLLGAYYNYADPSLGRGEEAGGRYVSVYLFAFVFVWFSFCL